MAINTLVLSSGGLLGFAYIGCWKRLEDLGVAQKITNFAGSSIGALFASLFSIGYSYAEMLELLKDVHVERYIKLMLVRLIEHGGLDDGIGIERLYNKLIRKHLKLRKEIVAKLTFAELEAITGKKLTVVGYCINKQIPVYFNAQLTPNFRVVHALRISTSIPVVFPPVIVNDMVLVDGGFYDSCPLHLFNPEETIGIEVDILQHPCITPPCRILKRMKNKVSEVPETDETNKNERGISITNEVKYKKIFEPPKTEDYMNMLWNGLYNQFMRNSSCMSREHRNRYKLYRIHLYGVNSLDFVKSIDYLPIVEQGYERIKHQIT